VNSNKQENDWLTSRLTAQAQQIPAPPLQIPTAFDLRERLLRRRERTARWTTYAAGSVMAFSMFGWSLRGLDSGDTHSLLPANPISSEIPELRVVGNPSHNPSDSIQPSYRMKARWWEPVPVEWVDASGNSHGFAGFVAEERSTVVDPDSLNSKDRQRVIRAVESYPFDGTTF
jgi:hypothetical protein